MLPFLAGMVDAALRGGHWLFVVQIYAAVIAPFICGIHWGAALVAPEGRALRLFVVSNMAALVPPRPGFLLLATTFGALLLVDRHVRRSGLWPDWFRRLRLVITSIVVGACLCIAVAAP